MGNDSPPHLRPNLHFILQSRMTKCISRSGKGLLNTLQGAPGLCQGEDGAVQVPESDRVCGLSAKDSEWQDHAQRPPEEGDI